VAIGTPTSIGSVLNNNNTTNTAVISVTAAVAIGQKVIVVAVGDGIGTYAGAGVTCADSQLNVYTQDVRFDNTTKNANLFLFSADITTALTTSDTITATYDTTRGHRNAFACQISGLATGVSDFDQKSTAVGTSLSWTSNSTPTTTQADELIIGACMNNGSGAPTSTPTGGNTELFDQTDGGACELTVVYQIVTTTGAYAASGTWSTGTPENAALVGTYKAGAAPLWLPHRMPLGV
jgi:hypothetical protein